MLSILIISHNQHALLKRCTESVLNQKINCAFEVIISDDCSTDGTWELIEEYEKKFPQIIFGCKCNSDDCNPESISDRCAWNKLNAYLHSRGDYFVNIDADDYLKSDDIYQTQLEMLMAHPECSMCMQDVWEVKDGEYVGKGTRWPSYGKLRNGDIIDAHNLICKYRAVNPCYMIRAHREIDIAQVYGKKYDDTIITLHHLQFGNCVYVDRADYVWVRYKTSITGTLTGDDDLVENSLLPLHHILYIPRFASIFMEEGIDTFIHFFKILSERKFKLCLTERSLISLKNTEGYLYRILSQEQIGFWDKIKLSYIRFVLIEVKKHRLYTPYLMKYIYAIMTSQRRASLVILNSWK